MRDVLLAYLLEGLDPPERAEVERRLAEDPALREELERLRKQLEPLAEGEREYEPPPGLSRRTARSVCRRSHGDEPDAGRCTGFGVMDAIVLGVVSVAVMIVTIPAVNLGRHHSRVWHCQNNLRDLGVGLAGYSHAHNGLLPQLPTDDRLGVAGSLAAVLREAGYAEDPCTFLCPGLRCDQRDHELPSLAEVRQAPEGDVAQLQARLGGSYGYTLGRWVDGRWLPVRFLGRSHFAIASDAPSRHLPDLQSANHCGRGQNVLFEDGNVSFLTRPDPDTDESDNIFVNHCGYVAPGIDEEDSVVGSSDSPLVPRMLCDAILPPDADLPVLPPPTLRPLTAPAK